MTGEVIKQFLVSLGFGVDDKSLKGFMKAIDNTVTKVKVMTAAITAMAVGAFVGIAKISEDFEEMGYATRMIAPAINKAILLRQAMISAYKDAGINIVKAVQQSIKFNFALAKTRFQLEGIVKSTAMKFIPTLTKQMDIFRTKISANMPKILETLERFVKFIFKAFEGVVILGTRVWSMLSRVWDILERLDTATGGWSTKILAVVAAWKLLNLAFITTPIGMIITGLIALLALYDDFMTWQEGGDSLIDWSAWVPMIDGITGAFKGLWDIVVAIFGVLKNLGDAIISLVKLDFGDSLSSLLKTGDKLWDMFGGIADSLVGIGNFQFGLVDGIASLFDSSPALGSTGGNTSSQNVSQSTNIIVQGSSDPQATARIVGNEQNRVNSNMARNMKGAAR